MRPAVFVDRDGTLIEERGYLDRVEQLALFPWTADAIRLLNRAGLPVVVITNQAAVGRGIIDEPFLAEVHAALEKRLALREAGRLAVEEGRRALAELNFYPPSSSVRAGTERQMGAEERSTMAPTPMTLAP